MDRLGEEQAAWLGMKSYELPGPALMTDRRDLYRLLARVFVADRAWAMNIPVSEKIAAELGIKPTEPDNLSEDIAGPTPACEPMIEPATSKAG